MKEMNPAVLLIALIERVWKPCFGKTTGEEVNDEAMVPSRLWKFIADDGGVCQHLFEFEILTKLNGNEIKFLYGTNTESRLAIKRAKIKLSKKFWISELSSIS